MSITTPVLLPRTHHERRAYEAFYHEHKEAHVPQSIDQDVVSDEVGDALRVCAPDLWVARDLCCYWIHGDNKTYLAPDVVVGEAPRPVPGMRSYRQWEHGRLRLVLEVASESSRAYDRGAKLDRYAESLRPDEYVYFDPDNGDLRMWRWSGEAYHQVPSESDGRVWSAATEVRLVVEGRRLRIQDREGTALWNYDEAVLAARAAEEQAAAATTRIIAAEALAEREAARAEQEAARAEREAARAEREAARAAPLEAELARLRAIREGHRDAG